MNRAIEYAREFVRGRLQRAEGAGRSHDDRGDDGRPESVSSGARIFLDRLHRETHVRWELAPTQQSVRQLISFSRDSLPPSLEADWRRVGLPNDYETFAYEILHTLQRISTRSTWKAALAQLPATPASEEELLNALLSLSWKDLLLFASQLVPEEDC